MVFITHDFDDAIRLADRIAIMKDGAVIQVATPEELVLRPATNYVAAFTRHVNRAKVMTAHSLMRPVTPGGPNGRSVPASAKIASFAAAIPMLLLFGISPVSALLATGLFATPPMVRATMLGLRKVKPEIK